jgi:membrane protease subunit (stomatin/prohibitin family)
MTPMARRRKKSAAKRFKHALRRPFEWMGIGLGMMAGVGGGIANMVGGAVNTAFNGVPAQPSAPADTFCENCGAKLTPDAAFCDECGTKVAIPNNICRNCGYQFERPGKFCPKCGTKREG